MIEIPAVKEPTIETSSIDVLPSEALLMAKNAKKKVALTRDRLTNKAWDTCKNEQCDHKFLGFKYFSHPMWEDKAEFIKQHPLMRHLTTTMDMAEAVCDSVIVAAEYKLSHPEDDSKLRISLSDFALLNGDL